MSFLLPAMPEPSFADDRGTITDLLVTPLDGVTRIFTKAGATRGNHAHFETRQFTYVVAGRLLTAIRLDDGVHEAERGPGDLVEEPPGFYHAWRALTDCEVLVFTKGPRTGSGYEDDVTRLAPQDRLL